MENIKFKYADNPEEGCPAMMDGLDPMSGEGLIFNNVETVSIKNIKFDGLKKPRITKTGVAKFTEN